MGGIFDLSDGLNDDDIVTVCSPVDHGYCKVRDAQGTVFTVAMQEVDCGTLYEVESGLFLPPRNQRVSAEVTRQRAFTILSAVCWLAIDARRCNAGIFAFYHNGV